MVKTLIGITAVVFAAVACSPAARQERWHGRWDKPGMTGEVFEQDVRDCDRQAMKDRPGMPAHQGTATAGARTVNPAQPTLQSDEHHQAYDDCMKSKGYSEIKGN